MNTPAMTHGGANERRLQLQDASLVHGDIWGYGLYTVAAFVAGGAQRFCQFPSLSEAAQELARLTNCCFVDMLQISGICAEPRRCTSEKRPPPVVGHLRIVGRASSAPWFDFRLSEYYRLITVTFRGVRAIPFAELWADFDVNGVVDPAELAVAQLFFEGCLCRGILSVDLGGITVNVPWGTPASVFNFLGDAAPERFADSDRFLSLSSVPGLTADSFLEFVDRVVKAIESGQIVHHFEFLFKTDGNPLEFVKHRKLLRLGGSVMYGVTLWKPCYVITFKDQSVFSVDYDPAPNLPTPFIVRYGRPEQNSGDESNDEEEGTSADDDGDSNDDDEDTDDSDRSF